MERLQSAQHGWNEQDFRASAYTRRTITYIYDPLYRLTRASYSDSKDFRYQYDSVGNRTRYTETTPALALARSAGASVTSTNVITYAYDAANRPVRRVVAGLTNVDGVAYTWDNNPTPLRSGDWRGNRCGSFNP